MNLNEECLLDYLSCLLGKPKPASQKGVVPVRNQTTGNTTDLSEQKHQQQINDLIKKSLQ